MRRGATDYIPKPFTPAQVNLVVRRVAEVRSLEQKVTVLRDELGRSLPEADFTSTSPAMQRAVNLAREVAPTDASVLLRGESGTGKSALARAIHYWSNRSEKPMGVVSCPSISPELLESELFGHVKGAFTGAVRDIPVVSPRVKAALCSLTKLGTCRGLCSQSCCASFRTANMSGSVITSPEELMCA